MPDSTRPTRGQVLLVDDDADLREVLRLSLEEASFEVYTASRGEDALDLLEREPVEVLLTDLRMRGLDGLEVCRRACEIKPQVPVIVTTAFGDMAAAVSAIRAGAYDFLSKPVETDALEIALDRAVQHKRLSSEIGELQRRLETLSGGSPDVIGESREIKSLWSILERAAQSDSTVLITGETGSGKELVARSLHARSPRAAGPFVPLNCAAVPEALLESELFGHTRGAFTDAKTQRQGLFQRADGGTVFLDEIGDMPPVLQAKLLRVLQERRVRPVGSDREIPVEVRVIAATHRDLEAAVEEGTFRQDLLYRINVIQLEVPPLRDRGNDVLLLAQHFLERYAARAGRAIVGFSAEAAAKLVSYDWPGNVRELQNCVERAVALTRHDRIVVADLAPRVRAHEPSPGQLDDEIDLIPLEQVERRHILRVLQAVGGNKARAASILRIGRKTLYRKLELYGVT